MESSTLSSKYQIVVPKKLRAQLNIKPGQKMHISIQDPNTIIIRTNSALDQFVGSVKGVWGDDPVSYTRKMRDEWDD